MCHCRLARASGPPDAVGNAMTCTLEPIVNIMHTDMHSLSAVAEVVQHSFSFNVLCGFLSVWLEVFVYVTS